MSVDEEYARHRGLVIRVAYDVTGSWVDAEDIAQQTYVRWRNAHQPVHNARAYLARIAINLALDTVARREKVGYPGPFLPEPVATGQGTTDALDDAAEVEAALMVVLGTLSPLERAAFLLHDVFSFTHAEIGVMLDREPAAIRQLTSRARSHVAARRPDPSRIDRTELVALTERFLAAARTGDLAGLTAHLTDDVVFIADGGGRRAAAMRPVRGGDKVGRLLLGLAKKVTDTWRLVPIEVNHRLAIAIFDGDTLDQVLWFVFRDGRIAQALSVRNPDKLVGVTDTLRAMGHVD